MRRKRALTAGPDSGELVAQANGGALLTGGMEGNAGGPGAMPSAIREYCRGAFAKRVPVLEAIADGQPLKFVKIQDGTRVEAEITASVKERVQAIDILAKYGGVDKLAITVEEQPEQVITPERAADIWAKLEVVKSVRNIERILTKGLASGGGTDAG